MPPDDGFFDLQVNGYAGVDFNSDNLTADALHTACRRLSNERVSGILATVITGTIARDKARGAYERRAEGLTVSPLVRDGGYGVRFELIH